MSEMLKRMEKEGLVKKYKNSQKPGFVVELTEKGREVLDQSRYNESDEKILGILTKKQRERLASYLWSVRNQALRELGIPEWSIKFPSVPAENNNE